MATVAFTGGITKDPRTAAEVDGDWDAVLRMYLQIVHAVPLKSPDPVALVATASPVEHTAMAASSVLLSMRTLRASSLLRSIVVSAVAAGRVDVVEAVLAAEIPHGVVANDIEALSTAVDAAEDLAAMAIRHAAQHDQFEAEVQWDAVSASAQRAAAMYRLRHPAVASVAARRGALVPPALSAGDVLTAATACGLRLLAVCGEDPTDADGQRAGRGAATGAAEDHIRKVYDEAADAAAVLDMPAISPAEAIDVIRAVCGGGSAASANDDLGADRAGRAPRDRRGGDRRDDQAPSQSARRGAPPATPPPSTRPPPPGRPAAQPPGSHRAAFDASAFAADMERRAARFTESVGLLIRSTAPRPEVRGGGGYGGTGEGPDHVPVVQSELFGALNDVVHHAQARHGPPGRAAQLTAEAVAVRAAAAGAVVITTPPCVEAIAAAGDEATGRTSSRTPSPRIGASQPKVGHPSVPPRVAPIRVNTNAVLDAAERVEAAAAALPETSLCDELAATSAGLAVESFDPWYLSAPHVPAVPGGAVAGSNLSPQQRIVRSVRASLGVAAHRATIERAILGSQHDTRNAPSGNAQFIFLAAATGTGKTTQIPQYIVERAARSGTPCRVVVGQPRRVSAVSVATRISEESETALGFTAGYHIRGDYRVEDGAPIVVATYGVLMRLLTLATTAPLDTITHLIFDEVHERTAELDLLLSHVVSVLLSSPRPLTVVLMSATMDGSDLRAYVEQRLGIPQDPNRNPTDVVYGHGGMSICSVAVPAPTQHPIHFMHLETVVAKMASAAASDAVASGLSPAKWGGAAPRALHGRVHDVSKCAADAVAAVERFYRAIAKGSIHSFPAHFLVDMIVWIHTTQAPGGIMMFAMAYSLMLTLRSLLAAHPIGPQLDIVMAHSSSDQADIDALFQRAPPGTRRVVLASAICETAVTLPDMVYCIDLGIAVTPSRDGPAVSGPAFGSRSLRASMAAQAALTQRAGRVGRTRPGVVIRPFPAALVRRLPLQPPVEAAEHFNVEHLVFLAATVASIDRPLPLHRLVTLLPTHPHPRLVIDAALRAVHHGQLMALPPAPTARVALPADWAAALSSGGDAGSNAACVVAASLNYVASYFGRSCPDSAGPYATAAILAGADADLVASYYHLHRSGVSSRDGAVAVQTQRGPYIYNLARASLPELARLPAARVGSRSPWYFAVRDALAPAGVTDLRADRPPDAAALASIDVAGVIAPLAVGWWGMVFLPSPPDAAAAAKSTKQATALPLALAHPRAALPNVRAILAAAASPAHAGGEARPRAPPPPPPEEPNAPASGSPPWHDPHSPWDAVAIRASGAGAGTPPGRVGQAHGLVACSPAAAPGGMFGHTVPLTTTPPSTPAVGALGRRAAAAVGAFAVHSAPPYLVKGGASHPPTYDYVGPLAVLVLGPPLVVVGETHDGHALVAVVGAETVAYPVVAVLPAADAAAVVRLNAACRLWRERALGASPVPAHASVREPCVAASRALARVFADYA